MINYEDRVKGGPKKKGIFTPGSRFDDTYCPRPSTLHDASLLRPRPLPSNEGPEAGPQEPRGPQGTQMLLTQEPQKRACSCSWVSAPGGGPQAWGPSIAGGLGCGQEEGAMEEGGRGKQVPGSP